MSTHRVTALQGCIQRRAAVPARGSRRPLLPGRSHATLADREGKNDRHHVQRANLPLLTHGPAYKGETHASWTDGRKTPDAGPDRRGFIASRGLHGQQTRGEACGTRPDVTKKQIHFDRFASAHVDRAAAILRRQHHARRRGPRCDDGGAWTPMRAGLPLCR